MSTVYLIESHFWGDTTLLAAYDNIEAVVAHLDDPNHVREHGADSESVTVCELGVRSRKQLKPPHARSLSAAEVRAPAAAAPPTPPTPPTPALPRAWRRAPAEVVHLRDRFAVGFTRGTYSVHYVDCWVDEGPSEDDRRCRIVHEEHYDPSDDADYDRARDACHAWVAAHRHEFQPDLSTPTC